MKLAGMAGSFGPFLVATGWCVMPRFFLSEFGEILSEFTDVFPD